MNCTIASCPGEYEPRQVVHTVRQGDRTVVVEDVPADVCPVCGDVLFSPQTVRGIDQILASHERPVRTAPVFDFPTASTDCETA